MIRKPERVLHFLFAIAVAVVTASPWLNRVGTAASLQAEPPAASPVRIGTQSAGTFADATGHSAQSHLVYAANAGVWWLFTLTSAADSPGGANHIVKAYRSSGADLATAVWAAATDSPGASVSAGFAPNGVMGGGRALGIAYVNNAPTDIIHAEVAIAANGQDGITGHIRARLTATAVTWETWNYKVEGAATWTVPRTVSLGLSNGKFVHSGGPTLQQEVDANARRSNNPDTGATWTSGFSSVVVIDNSMLNQCNALAFAPLAGETMLAVYDNGRGSEPNQTNLRYKRSNANGTWTGVVVGSQLGGDGDVFGTTATIDQNDWTLVPLSATSIRAYRRNAAGTGVDAAAYNVSTNSWSSAPAPPPFGAGQAFKNGGGLFGARDASSTWLFAISTDAANTILYTRHDGASWSSWAPVPGTNSGTHTRRFLSGQPVAGAGQIGLTWTEGTSTYDIFAAALPIATTPDTTPPVVSLLAPGDGSTVFGNVSLSASASDDRSLAGVQFQLDGANLGARQTTAPFGLTWNSRDVANGTHSIAAIATDGAGNAGSAFASVSVDNRPVISSVTATPISASSESITWTTDVAATTVVDFGLTTAYGTAVSDPVMVTNHQVDLTGLAAGTTYHYQVTSVDTAGNPATAGDFTFTTGAVDTTPPTIVARTPAPNATGISTATTVRATFSEAMNATTITGATFSLRNAANTLIPATVAYNATTLIATVTPSAALAAGQTYTATVAGGSAGVKDAAGHALAANSVWSFTTAPAPAGDTVTIQRLEYTAGSRQLRVEARSTATGATLTAFVTSTGAQIGTLSNNGGGRYRATFTWPTNPQNVTVRSSLGGQASAAVVLK